MQVIEKTKTLPQNEDVSLLQDVLELANLFIKWERDIKKVIENRSVS